MAQDAAPFSDSELDAIRLLFPGDDIQVHDGTLVIARPPDAAARFATGVITRSLHEHLSRCSHLTLEESSEVRFDPYNVRRYSIALWNRELSVPIFVVVVLGGEDHMRWGRGKVNRALELGVSRGLLVDPKRQDVIMFEGIERTTVGNYIECDLITGWALAKTAIFNVLDDAV